MTHLIPHSGRKALLFFPFLLQIGNSAQRQNCQRSELKVKLKLIDLTLISGIHNGLVAGQDKKLKLQQQLQR